MVKNPVVSLDDMSVFAKRERQEQIAKKTVCCFYFLVLIEFGQSSRHFLKF